MNSPHPDPLLALLLRAAETVPGGDPHPFDDPNLATRWVEGLLATEESARIAGHLADCQSCRAEAAELARAGMFRPADSVDETATVSGRGVRKGWFWRPVVVAAGATIAIAATLLLVVMPLIQKQGSGLVRAEPTELALGSAAFDRGEWGEALDRAGRALPGEDRQVRDRIIEESAYRLGRDSLTSGRFDDAREAEHRAESAGVRSSRLANLRIQAERRETAEVSLFADNALIEHGVAINGARFTDKSKSIIGMNPAILKSLTEAAAQYPNDAQLLTNLGEYLLAHRKYAEAETRFAEAVRAAPGFAPGWIGLGVVRARQQGKEADALAAFETAARLDPTSIPAAVGVATALGALNRHAEAKDAWQAALALPLSPGLRESVEGYLKLKSK